LHTNEIVIAAKEIEMSDDRNKFAKNKKNKMTDNEEKSSKKDIDALRHPEEQNIKLNDYPKKVIREDVAMPQDQKI
jgi:hypothetical protein